MRIPGYSIQGMLSSSTTHAVYRARRERDEQPVLIKTAPGGRADGVARARLEREYSVTRDLPFQGLLPILELALDGPGAALILEDRGGDFLRNHLAGDPLDVAVSLTIAVKLASILATLHRSQVVHQTLCPDHIVVDLDAGQVWLTGFTQASRYPGEDLQSGPAAMLDGFLAYASPEQTGRMNRRVDYRTDFYSLGVTLYEMLTGRLPFEADEPLELVHAHIARKPAPPHTLRSDVPRPLSDLVMKLLAKTAEERYQSAQGLQVDLEACLHGKAGSDFVPGAHDVSDQFQIPQTLYGRAPEIETLLNAFDRVSQGATELLLVSGYSGIGKSSLVHEVHKPIVRQRGYFVSGKFDQFKRNIPYSALITAFQELVRHLLTESESAVAAWRDQLHDALGPNGQVLVEVIPEVELVIGPQPPVPVLPPAETQNRFNLVFDRFLRVFTKKGHPLVLFLDDLQWADAATLRLLQTLATDQTRRYLLVLGAYRDNEVDATHPLTQTLAEIEADGAVMHVLTLQPLGPDDLIQFVADTLRGAPETARPLAELVRRKTNGNPFFTIQFLKSLYLEGLIAFDYEQGAWQYDLARIEGLGITDNVVDLMVRKIRRLSDATQTIVKLAACIGNTFDLYTLSIVSEATPEQAAADLEEALHEGLLLPASDPATRIVELKDACPVDQAQAALFRFLHDRVQQAAYSLIPDAEKRVVHLRVGRLLLQHCDAEALDERLFDIVGHLNTGAPFITDREERTRLAALNVQAGRKAKTSTAYQPALNYFKEGIAHLPVDAWKTQYDLAFALHLEQAECEYLCGYFDEAEQELDRLLEQVQSPLEQAEIYRIRIVQYENTDRFPEAREWGKKGLALFGIVFPDDDAERQASLNAETQEINEKIGGRDIEDLVDLPVMTDEAMRMSMKLLMTMWAPSYISGDMMLTVLIATKMVNLSLTYGNVEESAYGYITYAIAVGPRQGDFAAAYAFGRLALAVNATFDDLTARAKVNHMFSCYISFWRKSIATCFPHSREAYRSGLESGDFIYAAYGAFHESWHALFSGYQLAQYQTQYSQPLAFLAKAKYQSFYDAHQLMLHWGQALQGQTRHPWSLTGDDFDEAAYLATYRELAFFANFYYVAKLNVLYLGGAYEEAAEIARKAEAVAYGTRGMIWDAWLCFYHALTLSAFYATLDDEARKSTEQKLDALGAQLKVWAEHCPENFESRYQLVRAEQAALQGNVAEAIAAYERAIASAAENGFVQIEALAHECFARFWTQRGNETIARLYRGTAHRRYHQWGALAKVRALEAQHPHLLTPAEGKNASAYGPEALDVKTVIKAAQILSGEIEQRQLLDKLMQVVMENAGAQRGFLLLERDDQFVVEAAGTAPEDDPAGLQEAPGAWDRYLSSAVVHYVARVGAHVVLADAAHDVRFENDPYIREHAPLSVLCTPILHHGKPIGILYLENNLARDVFTPDRAEVVRILAAQAAISLENARLYEESRQEVAERRRIEGMLRALTEGTAAATGRAFFQSLVEHLTVAFGVRRAFVTECADADNHRVRTLAFLKDGVFLEDIEYDVAGTPCEAVIGGQVAFYPDRVEERFPQEKGVVSYLGVPIQGVSGQMLGHVAVMDDKPMQRSPHDISMLQTFAARASAELERKHAEEALQRAHDGLERRVEERTDELSQANARLQQEIAERERAETALRESENAYRDFYLDAPNVYISVGVDGLIRRANRRAAELFGFDLDAFIGKPISSLVADTPSGKPRAKIVFERFLAGEESLGEEVEFVRADGSHFWGSVSVNPYRNAQGDVEASRSIIVDITERKRMEEALRHRVAMEELIAQVSTRFINLAPDEIDNAIAEAIAEIGQFSGSDRSFICLFSEDGRTARFTHEWRAEGLPARLDAPLVITRGDFPWTFRHMQENRVLHVPRVDEMPDEAAHRKRQLQAEGVRSNIRVPMMLEGRPFGFLGFDAVRREKTWSEEDIRLLGMMGESFVGALARRQTEVQLKQAKEAAEAANRAKSEFLANMSHELRTPLNAVLGYAQILKRDARLAESQRAGLAVIERSGEHLLTLINDILDLSKIEAGKLEVQPTEFHLPEFLRSIADMARIRAEQKGLAFLYEPSSPLPALVQGDERRLRQVLLNLLGNAVKFTEKGGVTFKVGCYDAAPGLTRLRFQVEDTGVGIALEDLDVIFQPFQQAGAAQQHVEGTGLGLTISQRLVRLMGGELYVESTPGRGSTFWVDLALPVTDATQATALLPDEERLIVGFDGPPKRILVVDDKWENRSVLTHLLTPLGFDLLEAENGREALDKAAAFRPDLVLMDLVMPVMDGFEATRRLRQLPGFDEVAIIALSASVFEHNRQQSKDAGCSDFLQKPVRAALLLECLQIHLELEWIYGEAPAEKAHADSLSSAAPAATPAAVVPTQEAIQRLHELALMGHVQGLLAHLDHIDALDEACRPFTAPLRRMAQDYDMKRIRASLMPYLETDE